MSVTLEKLKSELVGLTVAESAELAHFLIDSIDTNADEDAESAGDTELARRAAEIQRGRVHGKPAEQVFAELRVKRS